MTASDPQLRHGQPKVIRREAWGLDKYEWPSGSELFIYDDGPVKLGRWDSTVTVIDVSNFARGKSQASAHIVARFEQIDYATSQPSDLGSAE
jgi:hypothetical protein